MITFAMILFGNSQINYLKVLLQSIFEIYQNDASAILYYANVSLKYIEEIKNKISFILLKEQKEIGYEGSFRQRSLPSCKTAGWYQIIKEQRWPEYFAFVDIDTLIVNKIDKYFSNSADIIYTYKTNVNENLNWPLNSGVVLAKNSSQSLKFFKKWRNETFKILNETNLKREKLLEDWGGEDQASMGRILGNRNREQYRNVILYDSILLQGVPCEQLNETRCVSITNSTHIIHYKGRWRPVLNGNGFTQYRPKEKCLKMYELWMDTLKRWNINI